MIQSLSIGDRRDFDEFCFSAQDGEASFGRGSSLVANNEQFAILAERLGIKMEGAELSDLRIAPQLAETYIVQQFGAWQKRKEANNEAHEDSRTRFQELPTDVQQNVARLAEMRMVVLKVALTSDGFSAYLRVGQELKGELDRQYSGDSAKMLGEIRDELEAKVANGQPLTVDRIEKRFAELCGRVNEDFTSYSDLLLRIHHGLWHSNLEKPHEFAYRMDDLPTDPVIDAANPTKSRPNGLRIFSDKANLLNIVGQLIAFSNTIEGHPGQQLVQAWGDKIGNPGQMVVPRMGSLVRGLDKEAVINNVKTE